MSGGDHLARAVLDAPRRGCVNIHASILPKWRGAGPIQWSIVHGDDETHLRTLRSRDCARRQHLDGANKRV